MRTKRSLLFAVPAALGVAFAFMLSVPAAAAPEDTLDQALTEILAANRVSGSSGSWRRDNPGEYTRVIAYLDGGARPAEPLSRLGRGLVLVEDARRELVGDPDPTTTTTTTDPEPPPPPPPTSNCLVSNWQAWTPESCSYGTTITVTNAGWSCSRPLAQYGALPIRVLVSADRRYDAAGGITIDGGCTGDGNADTVDLIGFVYGNGARGTFGPGNDAFKTRGYANGPVGVQVTGRFDCGPQAPGAHQDMVQFQGGRNVTLVNVTSGDWDAGLATCQGAGGVIYTNGGQNIDIVGSRFVGCNHGIVGGNAAQNEITDSGSRSGRTDGTDPNCVGFAASNACGPGPAYVRVVCQRWDPAADVWRDQ